MTEVPGSIFSSPNSSLGHWMLGVGCWAFVPSSSPGRRTCRIIFIACLLQASIFCAPTPGQETDIYWGDLLDQGVAWVEENTTIDIDATMDAAFAVEDWGAFFNETLDALHADSYETMASLEPRVRWAVDRLDQVEGAEPYADWLRQRLDFFQVADEYVHPPPPPVRTTVTPPPRRKPEPAPSRKPPSAPVRTRPRPRPQTVEVWKIRLAERSPPAGAERLVPELKKIFREEGVPEELVWLAEVESSFNPSARSPVGAVGLYQLMPATAESLGISTAPDDERLHAQKNARAAARYLRSLHERFESWDLALAAYNAGQGRVGKALKRHGGRTFDDIAHHLPSETRMYVPKVMATVHLREKVDLRALAAPSG